MRRAASLTLSALLLALLAACGAPAPQPQDKAAAREKGRDTDETVLDDMIQTQDRARALEGVTLGHKADMDATIDEQAGEAAPDDR